MKQRIATALILIVLVILSARFASALAQGSLTPTNAPAPTMKTLDQIEPRKPITALPYTVEEPGSYYLTGPHNSTNTGITISSSDVTIDLMGFTLRGSQNPNHVGIQAVGGEDVMLRNIVIRNGGVSQFGVGILIDNTQSGRVQDVVVHQNSAQGIFIRQTGNGICSDITVENCQITDNGGTGIYVFGEIEASRNRGHTIRNNSISGNFTEGIFSVRAYGCLFEGNVIGPQTPATNAYAIRSGLGRNWIVRNVSQGNTNLLGTPFVFVSSGDTFGPTVTTSGMITNGVSPWANFSR
jgi:hypothetical protein